MGAGSVQTLATVQSGHLSGTGDSQRDSRESFPIRANHSQLKPLFFIVRIGRFARITRISDSRESPDSRESCESIRANHATKLGTWGQVMYISANSWPWPGSCQFCQPSQVYKNIHHSAQPPVSKDIASTAPWTTQQVT